MHDPILSIVLGYYRRSEQWRRTLLSIEAQNPRTPYEILVVNDDVPDAEFQRVCSDFNKKNGPIIRAWNTRRTLQYRGPCFPFNIALRNARGRFLIHQNPEVMHIGPVIDRMAEILEGRPKAFLCCRCTNLTETDHAWLRDNNTWIGNDELLRSMFDYPQRGEYVGRTNPRPFYFLAGAHRSLYYDIGGLDERFLYLNWEDDWHQFLLERNGAELEILYDEAIMGLHQWHPTNHDPAFFERANEMRNLYNQLVANVKERGASPRANPGTTWGQAPVGSEIQL